MVASGADSRSSPRRADEARRAKATPQATASATAKAAGGASCTTAALHRAARPGRRWTAGLEQDEHQLGARRMPTAVGGQRAPVEVAVAGEAAGAAWRPRQGSALTGSRPRLRRGCPPPPGPSRRARPPLPGRAARAPAARPRPGEPRASAFTAHRERSPPERTEPQPRRTGPQAPARLSLERGEHDPE